MQATITNQPTIPTPNHNNLPLGPVTAAEKAEKLILRWYETKTLHPRTEWDVFGVATQALIYIEQHGVVAFIESTPPALPESAEITQAIWPVLQGLADRAMTITRTPWTGGAYVWEYRCKCESDEACDRYCRCYCPDCY
jgi:hypothetical protein